MSGDVNLSCGTSETDYLESASLVLDRYCDPDVAIDFTTQTGNVDATTNPWGVDEAGYLAPCALSGLMNGYISNVSIHMYALINLYLFWFLTVLGVSLLPQHVAHHK